jgi:hypothetical protein
MNIIDLTHQHVDIFRALELAHDGPLILIAPDGREYMLAEADDFDREVELLRSSTAFQQFLDQRLAAKHHIDRSPTSSKTSRPRSRANRRRTKSSAWSGYRLAANPRPTNCRSHATGDGSTANGGSTESSIA